MGIKLKIEDIQHLLNRSASDLSTDTLDKLQCARRSALQYQQTTQPTAVHAWLSQHGVIGHHPSSQHRVLSLGLAALFAVVLVSGISYWQLNSERDHSAIDIAILTDDLPVHMYVD